MTDRQGDRVDEYAEMSDEELLEREQLARSERWRRRELASAPAQMETLVANYQAALGRQGGDRWVQPTGPLDAYPLGAVHEHGGRLWSSLRANNQDEPGHGAWRLVASLAQKEGEPDG